MRQTSVFISYKTGEDDGLTFTATTSMDRTTRVWKAGTDQILLTLSGHTDSVSGIAFSPDGRRLNTSSADRTVRVYASSIEDLMTLARTRVSRGLTQAECRKYLVTPCPAGP